MKKKYLILPSLMLILSVLATYILVYWASPFTSAMHSVSVYTDIESGPVEVKKGYYEHLEKVYELTPNESTLYSLIKEYYPYRITYSRIEKLPEHFFENCVKYKKMQLEIAKTDGKNSLMGPYDSININSVVYVFSNESYILDIQMQYVTSLYLSGDKENARLELDRAIEYYKGCTEKDASVMLFKLPFEILYAYAESDSDREWITEKELELTKWTQANKDLTDEYMQKENLFENRTLEELKREGW